MKQKVYFYTSTIKLNEIPAGAKIYDKLTNCIMEKSYKLTSKNGIDSTKEFFIKAEKTRDDKNWKTILPKSRRYYKEITKVNKDSK